MYDTVTSTSLFARSIIATCAIALAMSHAACLFFPYQAHAQMQTVQPIQPVLTPIAGQSIQTPVDASKIIAKRVLLVNMTTGETIYEKDALTVQPLASLTKLMTAVTVREMYAIWANPPKRIRLISRTSAQTAADRQVAVGGYMKTDDLISYMLLSSSNFAAQSLASGIIDRDSFISYMNFTARNLGLSESRFVNASGLTERDGSGSTGNAKDVMKLLDIIVKKYPQLATATRSGDALIRTSSGKAIAIDNPNKSLERIPGIYLGKTGYTDEAGGNLALVIKRNGAYYGIVVLGSTIDGRFSDAEYLASLIPMR